MTSPQPRLTLGAALVAAALGASLGSPASGAFCRFDRTFRTRFRAALGVVAKATSLRGAWTVGLWVALRHDHPYITGKVAQRARSQPPLLQERRSGSFRCVLRLTVKDNSSYCAFHFCPPLTARAEGWPSGQRQQTVNLPTYVYEGSNPSPSTRRPYACRVGDLEDRIDRQRSRWRDGGQRADGSAGVAQW
jgi:hypothetical protein